MLVQGFASFLYTYDESDTLVVFRNSVDWIYLAFSEDVQPLQLLELEFTFMVGMHDQLHL